MSTPTSRALEECKKRGWSAAVVEKWVPAPKHPARGVRKDVFGFGDVLVATGSNVLLIQATSGSNGAARVAKIKTECREDALKWLRSGGLIEVWAWRKLKKKVDRKSWQVKVFVIDVCDLENEDEIGVDQELPPGSCV